VNRQSAVDHMLMLSCLGDPKMPLPTRLIVPLLIALVPLASHAAFADREVVWITSRDATLERELNAQAARGLRAAAVSDGLPCAVTVMQAPAQPMPAASYRVVADRDLEKSLPPLTDEGYVPRFAQRSATGRAFVIFERTAADRPGAAWQLVEFTDMNALAAALEAPAREGFQPRLLARYPLRTWPGLSERGQILLSKGKGAKAREIKVVAGQSRNIDTVAKAVADAAAAGFDFELLATGSRDGSRMLRRERVHVVLSRETGASSGRPIKLERESSFGTFGSGLPLGTAPFWDEDYVHAWSPADRRQTWASPIRLSENEAMCIGLSLKLRIDAPRDLAWDIIGLAARKVLNGYELIYLTDQR
jgi:hypothetical protein